MSNLENAIRDCAGVPTQQEKHITLYEAIESIKILRGKTARLLDRIKNQGEAGGVDVDPSQQIVPSLEQVLTEGSDSIRLTCEEICKTLEAIEQAIF